MELRNTNIMLYGNVLHVGDSFVVRADSKLLMNLQI
jgi:hypothetical protein